MSINENCVRRGHRNRARGYFWVGEMIGGGGGCHKTRSRLAIFGFDWRGGG